MEQHLLKYIRIRHWDYWWEVYQCGKQEPDCPKAVEFMLSDDREGRYPFFHLEFYNLPGLCDTLREGLFMEREDPDYPAFLRRAEALDRRELDYFVGALYYHDFVPDLTFCNQPLMPGHTLLDLTAPVARPYYGVLFLREEQPLTPEVLAKWVAALAKPLFQKNFLVEIADTPTRAEALASWQADHRF